MASDFDIKVEADNGREIAAAIREALESALETVGLVAEGYAKLDCPVDTGNLRNSITHVVDDDSVYIGTNVEYAPAVELGTHKQKAQPFLRPAADHHASEYRQIIEDRLKG